MDLVNCTTTSITTTSNMILNTSLTNTTLLPATTTPRAATTQLLSFICNNISNNTSTILNTTTNAITTNNNCQIFPSHLVYFTYTIGCSLLIIVTILLNVHELHAYYKRKVQHTNFNLALSHLSASNTLQAVGFLPYVFVDASSTLEGRDGAGLVARLTCGTSYGLSVFFAFTFCNAFIITLLSLHRYRAIRHPLDHEPIKPRNLTKCWIMGVAWLIPNMFTFQYRHPFCYRDFDSFRTLGQIYKISMLMCGMVFPLIVMTVTHVLTVRAMVQRTNSTGQNELGNSHAANKVMHRNKQSVTKTLTALVLIALISWVPFGLQYLVELVNPISARSHDPCARHKLVFTYKCVLLPSLLAPFCNILFYGSICKRYSSNRVKITPASTVSKRNFSTIGQRQTCEATC